MKKRHWRKIKKLPPEKLCVRIFVNYGDGNFNIYSAHQEHGVWFMYDPFTKNTRIFPQHSLVTHWKMLDGLPSEVKK